MERSQTSSRDALPREAQRTPRADPRNRQRTTPTGGGWICGWSGASGRWHAQAKADVARLVRALANGTFEVEVKRMFRFELTEAESRATGRLVPWSPRRRRLPFTSQPPRPWGHGE